MSGALFALVRDDGLQMPLSHGHVTVGRPGGAADVALEGLDAEEVLRLRVGHGGVWCQTPTPMARVLVNGVPTRAAALRPGDRLELGGVGFTLIGPLGRRRAGVTTELVNAPEAQRSFSEQHDVALRDQPDALVDHLALLYRLAALVGRVDDPGALAEGIVALISELLPVSSASCLRFDAAGVPQLIAATGESVGCEPSSTVIGYVWQERVSLLAMDASADPRLSGSWSISERGIRTVMCAPLRARDRVIGVLYVDCTHATRSPRPEDLALLESVASFVSPAFEQAQRGADLVAQRLQIDLLLHDMKGPLRIIDAAVSPLRDCEDAEQRIALCDRISAAAARLDGFFADVLRVAELEEGALALEIEADVDLHAVVARACGRWRPAMELVGVRLLVEVVDAPPPARVDVRLLERVLDNLIDNARVHSPFESSVTLELSSIGGGYRLVCRDEGPGIAPELREQIFARHGRVRPRARGHGLGLHFCRLAVQAHGGSIWAQGAPGDNQVVLEAPLVPPRTQK